MHAYPPVKPYQVHLRCVQFTSYRFLQTLPLPATPLRFGLSSPWSGRRLFLSTGRVCPLRWANKKRGAMRPSVVSMVEAVSGTGILLEGKARDGVLFDKLVRKAAENLEPRVHL